MKLGVSVWQDRVSPVLDTARCIRVVEHVDGRVVSVEDIELPEDPPHRRAERIAGLGVDTLICGAVSRLLAEMIAATQVRLVPFVAGEVDEVLAACVSGRFTGSGFMMPGCRRGRGGRGRGLGRRTRRGRGPR